MAKATQWQTKPRPSGTRRKGGPIDDVLARFTRMLDAVQAADSVPRFVESLNEILEEDGLVLVIRVLGDDGMVREQALQVLASGALTILRDPVEVIVEGRESAMKIASVVGGGELVLRCKRGRKGIVSQPMADLVVKVMRLHRSMVGAEIRGRATAMVLDAVPLGVVLVNSSSRVLLTNRAADEILALADGLTRDAESELRASTPGESDRLRQIIHDVAGVSTGEMDRPVGVLRLDRPGTSSSWLLAVIPVRARRRSDTVSEIAAIFITGTTEAEPSGIPAQSLERLFSLTPAEARLLIALVDGLGLDEIAEQFEVSKNTLRNQLNQVFRKTGTNKQSELVRMVLSSPAAMLNQRRYLDQD